MSSDGEVTGCFFRKNGQGYYADERFYCACTDDLASLDWAMDSSCASGARAAAVAPAVCALIASGEVWVGWYSSNQCNTAELTAGGIGGTYSIQLLCFASPGDALQPLQATLLLQDEPAGMLWSSTATCVAISSPSLFTPADPCADVTCDPQHCKDVYCLDGACEADWQPDGTECAWGFCVDGECTCE